MRKTLDPKISVITIDEFFEKTNYLRDVFRYNTWRDNTIPDKGEYYKIDSNTFVIIKFGVVYPFGDIFGEPREKLENIEIAYRDGETEYLIFDKKINELQSLLAERKHSKKIDKEILELKNARKRIPKYKNNISTTGKPFESYLQNVGYKTSDEKLKNKYLVFDVETNGLRTANDDLLSLSIYDPTTGIAYNRFFPLDLQPVILTGRINGITISDLCNEIHLSQEEIDWLNSIFHFNGKTLLSFSGGKGEFDKNFVLNYCKRHNLFWIENVDYLNIKKYFPKAPRESQGELTKDNLCRLFKIEGVKDVHSGLNDCVLEWKLFEKIYDKKLFFTNNCLYNYNENYIIPISIANSYPGLLDYAGIVFPKVIGFAEPVFEFNFPSKAVRKIKKFPTNITGVTIEHAINSMLNVAKQDNSIFLINNKKNLEFIGSLYSALDVIPIIEKKDGTVETTNEMYKEYVEEINNVTRVIMDNLTPTIDYLKNNIFCGSQILSQELVISEDKKLLALCDLSNDNNVVEIKTNNVLLYDESRTYLSENISRQLYCQQKGRNLFVLITKFQTHHSSREFKKIIDGLKIIIYKVDLKVFGDEYVSYSPSFFARKILTELIDDNRLTIEQLSLRIHVGPRTVQEYLKELKDNNAIVREGSVKTGVWRILIDLDGKKVPISKQLKFKEK